MADVALHLVPEDEVGDYALDLIQVGVLAQPVQHPLHNHEIYLGAAEHELHSLEQTKDNSNVNTIAMLMLLL